MFETKNRPLKVFLSYAREDRPIVRDLYRHLSAESWLDIWLDEEKLLPGQEWDLEIEKAVEAADVVLVCLSTNSVDKEGYVQKELRFVLNIADQKPEGAIFIIPIRLDECQVPRRLRMWQYGDYFPNECRKRAYERILQSLGLCSTRLGLFTASPAVEAHLVLQERARSDLSNAVESLTGREREILILIARGLSNGEIAMELSITERTTAKCVSVILGKLQLVNRTQAALFAIREGLT